MLLKFRYLGAACIVVLAMVASPQVFAKGEFTATGFVAMTCSEFLGYAAETKDAKWFIDMANHSGAAFLSGVNAILDYTKAEERNMPSVRRMPNTDVYYWYLRKDCANHPDWGVDRLFLYLWMEQPKPGK